MSDLKDPRVLFAAERTLLAWNRTSIALIAFGFLVERSGILMRLIPSYKADAESLLATMWIGLFFMLAGCLIAIYSSRQYSKVLKTLQPVEFPDGYSATWGITVNILVALLGFGLALALFWFHLY